MIILGGKSAAKGLCGVLGTESNVMGINETRRKRGKAKRKSA